MLSEKTFGNSIQQREKRFIELYKNSFPAVARHIRKMGGSLEEAQDVFQDALISYYEKEQTGSLSLKRSENAYLYGTARFLWNRKYRENNKTRAMDVFSDVGEPDAEQPSAQKIMRYLETAGKKCMELLKAFYYDNMELAAISEMFGFSGIRSATVQKYKCLEKVREKVKEKSVVYEDFLD